MKLFLNGGGSGDSISNIKQKINEIIDHNKKVLYIPLAWKDSSYQGCYEFITQELNDIDVAGIDMIRSKEELFKKKFTDYAFIYIGGGNTYKLLKELKDSGSFEELRKYLVEDDGIIFGGSAGAIIFGKDLDSCKTDDSNDVKLEDHNGFNMINEYSLLCHYTNRDEERTQLSKNYLLELSKEKPIYALPEEDSIIINDNCINFIGTRPYYEFINGEIIEHDIELDKSKIKI